MKVFRNNADAERKALATAAFLRAVPKPIDFVGTDEEWVNEAMAERFKDLVRAGKRMQDQDNAPDLDASDVI